MPEVPDRARLAKCPTFDFQGTFLSCLAAQKNNAQTKVSRCTPDEH